jgi:3-phosphoshikimate 1-carboxyvinyltransferase
MRNPFQSQFSGPLSGRIRVPGDKSISHRALMLGALSTGETTIEGLLEAADVLSTAKVLQLLGIPIRKENTYWYVKGRGVGGLARPDQILDFGNSGTSVRLMMGILAGHDFPSELTGDESLCRRPMGRVLKPLRQMGLMVADSSDDTLPLTVIGTSDLIPIDYEMTVASAQVKSAILLAGLHAPGRTTVIEPAPTRDHTERMLIHFGADLKIEEGGAGKAIAITGDQELAGQKVSVPGDPSSAAFLAGAALIKPGSEIVIENVLVNPTRIGFYETLIEMGGDITFENQREITGEPVADIVVRSSTLHGVTVPAARAPKMIDEYPCLAAIAAVAEGETKLEGLAELRVKESDRLSKTADGLSACGIANRIEVDDLIVAGSGDVPGGALIETDMDHRIAMSFLMLGVRAQNPITVDDISMVETSFPQFVDLMSKIGARFEDRSGVEA